MSLVFYEKSHRYKLDGQWVQGVTTLIGKGLPKPALVYWSAKSVAEFVADNPEGVETMRAMGRGPMVAALKSVPWEARDQAAVRGTAVHALAEKLVHGEEVEVPEHLTGYVEPYVAWLDRENVKPIWTERPVASRKWQYAGTFDLIAEFRGETWLLDVKTAKGVYGDNAVQLAGYAKAEFLVDNDGEEQPLPEIQRYGVIHVQEGDVQVHPVTDIEAAWKDFLHIAWVGRAQDRIKGYMAEPLEPLEVA